ncbi:MAG: hypothetical protein ACM31P_07950 [Actinomycetota bacterium]
MEQSLPFHMGLRDDRHMVSVIRQNGQSQVQLGVAYPMDGDRRCRIMEQWGIAARSPREESLDTIDLPLAQRSQAILFWQVSPALRGPLATGQGGTAGSRLIDNQAGMLDRAHLGTERQPMAVDARFGLRQAHGSVSRGK